MVERAKLLFICVEDDAVPVGKNSIAFDTSNRIFSPMYTRSNLSCTLQFMGCKARHAYKISNRAFELLGNELAAKMAVVKKKHSEFNYLSSNSESSDLSHFSDSLDSISVSRKSCKTTGRKLRKINFNSNPKEYSEKAKKISSEESLSNNFMDVELTDFDNQGLKATARISRDKFLSVVCRALAEYKYVGPNQLSDLILACKIKERKMSVIVLLCGTSGCGKSTLSSLLASRLGITTVVSTDSIRHMMRSFVDEKENPLLFASTYQAGEHLDLESIASAKQKKRMAKNVHVPLQKSSHSHCNKENDSAERNTLFDSSLTDSILADEPAEKRKMFESSRTSFDHENMYSEKCTVSPSPSSSSSSSFPPPSLFPSPPTSIAKTSMGSSEKVWTEAKSGSIELNSKEITIQGFKAQSEMIMDSLERLITIWEQRNESVIVEGVHLSLNFVMSLMKKHRSIIPFMIYISNEEKHMERFAVRSKYMTLDPEKNKYVKYIKNIRTIQDYLCNRADKHLVPKVNNTNIDKSVAAIHATVFTCLRHLDKGSSLYEASTNTVPLLNSEYQSQYAASDLSSKGMFQLIQKRGSFRNLMSLVHRTEGDERTEWHVPLENTGGFVVLPLNSTPLSSSSLTVGSSSSQSFSCSQASSSQLSSLNAEETTKAELSSSTLSSSSLSSTMISTTPSSSSTTTIASLAAGTSENSAELKELSTSSSEGTLLSSTIAFVTELQPSSFLLPSSSSTGAIDAATSSLPLPFFPLSSCIPERKENLNLKDGEGKSDDMQREKNFYNCHSPFHKTFSESKRALNSPPPPLPFSSNHSSSPVNVRFSGHGLSSWGRGEEDGVYKKTNAPFNGNGEEGCSFSASHSRSLGLDHSSFSGAESSGLDEWVGSSPLSPPGKHKQDWMAAEKEHMDSQTVFESEEECESGYEEGGETESETEELIRGHFNLNDNEEGSVDENLSLEDTAMASDDENEEEEKEWFHIPSTNEFMFYDLNENRKMYEDDDGDDDVNKDSTCICHKSKSISSFSHQQPKQNYHSSLDLCASLLKGRLINPLTNNHNHNQNSYKNSNSNSNNSILSSFHDYKSYLSPPPFPFKKHECNLNGVQSKHFPFSKSMDAFCSCSEAFVFGIARRSNLNAECTCVKHDKERKPSSYADKVFIKSKSDLSWDRLRKYPNIEI